MNYDQWTNCTDAVRMLEFVWEVNSYLREAPHEKRREPVSPSIALAHGSFIQRSLHAFYLASCRRVWPLLVQEPSRKAVELAEGFLNGSVTAEALMGHDYYAEGAAFTLDYNCDPEGIARWIESVNALPGSEFEAMLGHSAAEVCTSTHDLLTRAACFAEHASIYPSLRPMGPPLSSYAIFLSADVLRRHVSFPR